MGTRYLALSVLPVALCLSCGSSDPIGSSEGPAAGSQAQVVFITLNDYDSYLARVFEVARPMPVMVQEFAAITEDWLSQRTSDYWTFQFTLNLVERVGKIEKAVKGIRPQDPQLAELHTGFEAALETYGDAFKHFGNQIEFRSRDLLDEVNEKVRQGNVHLIRFQVLLGNLAGREITF